MEQLCTCCASLFGAHEFGNLSEYSQLSLGDIRERQDASAPRITYTIEDGGDAKSNASITLSYAYLCQRGYYPEDPDKLNQDSYIALEGFGNGLFGKSLLLGVFDGHGEYGDNCSQFVAERIASLFTSARHATPNDLDQAFATAYEQINLQLHADGDIDDQLSGTTACVALIEEGSCWIANCGDTRAIVGQLTKDGTITAKNLSVDQTPIREDECHRLQESGAVVMTLAERYGTEDNDPSTDPPRVWRPGRYEGGCAFSRSIGDSVAESVGVICNPEVTKKELRPHDKFICVASDGVWEFLESQVVTDIIAPLLDQDPIVACRAVVAESYRCWLVYDVRTDDITVALTYVDFSKKAQPDGMTKGRRKSVVAAGNHLENPERPSRKPSISRFTAKAKTAASPHSVLARAGAAPATGGLNGVFEGIFARRRSEQIRGQDNSPEQQNGSHKEGFKDSESFNKKEKKGFVASLGQSFKIRRQRNSHE
jgi:serine/threonine protein phosphatase PrpC